MSYTAEQEKYIAGLSRGMYIYFKGNSKPYEVLKVYGYVDPDTGEERKAIQYRLGALLKDVLLIKKLEEKEPVPVGLQISHGI